MATRLAVLRKESLSGVIPADAAGTRFDAALARTFPQYSRSRLAAWIKDGAVLLSGKPARTRDIVRGGEAVNVDVEIEAASSDAPEAIALNILIDDPAFLVLNKPAGLVVHPGAGNRTGTLVNALLHYDSTLAELPRAGVVHRLDKDTSGVMVVARTLDAHQRLVKALSLRNVRREYLALVAGNVISGGTVDAPIARHPNDRLKMAVVDDGRPAVSHYRVVERFAAHTLLRVQLETGRTHQIRVHMAHIRKPIVGDPLYGGSLKLPPAASAEATTALRGFKRQALHAETLAFAHPISGADVSTSAPPPADFLALLSALRA